jgi:hypothetical protein
MVEILLRALIVTKKNLIFFFNKVGNGKKYLTPSVQRMGAKK